MNILVEDTIPYGAEYFEGLGKITRYSWQSLQPADLAHTDYLVVRSTTRVDATLLSQARNLKLVTTATAGTNHLDKAALDAAGVPWRSAGGCNARAVAEYVLSALLQADDNGHLSLPAATVGIVGAGHVGSALAALLNCLGITCKLCDPPLAEQGDHRALVSLQEVLACDVISLHVPYTTTGSHPTYHLLDATALAGLSAHQCVINACRGEVIDEKALLTRLNERDAPLFITDVFWNEPDIDMAVTEAAWLATPHIAGHSLEGKTRGTQMVYEHVCEGLKVTPTRTLGDFLTPPAPLHLRLSDSQAERLTLSDLKALFFSVYDICEDDRHFRQAMAESNQFAALRKAYRVRRECDAYTVIAPTSLSSGIRNQLACLGFEVQFT
ncbi:4-phosphoerythronate dehydrogenase [Alteromonas sp. ASW11-19]|uniref:Erythronate-4-phosphate dehydrogenase n=1 Tax=Alteromonas salexigens TaxID=2982530 RepID=A0ABT2VSN7_9ALTE|nr:4-phosphoerythronate dehydrogenase [Alteromonas salexigens]MCU7555938.1 4-phosphoerythronate dehydrogenase [Alteromonas salexigens]